MRGILIGAMLLLTAAGAVAESTEKVRYGFVGLHATQQFFDIYGDSGSPDIDDTLLPGLQLGYRLNSRWSVQGWYEQGGYELEDSPGEGDARTVLLEARRHFPSIRLAGFEPYVGVSAQDFEVEPDNGRADNETLGALGFGLQRGLGERWRLDVGGRETWSFDEERRDGQLYIGVNWLFGDVDTGDSGASGKRDPGSDEFAMKVKDSDGDGVADPLDDCPGTEAGAEVDDTGCAAPTDSDGDGVVDAEDQCPDTAAGIEVNERGCEKRPDTDGDGVADADDQCPNTPAGTEVEATGCEPALFRSALDVRFHSGSARVQESTIPELAELAKLMRKHTEAELTLEGHTDDVGSAEANRRLSQQRAEAVKQVLVQRFGSEADRITAVGKGETEPVADNETEEGRAENRRVEAVLQEADE